MPKEFNLEEAVAATRASQLLAQYEASGTVEGDEVDHALEIARAEVAIALRLRRALTNVTGFQE